MSDGGDSWLSRKKWILAGIGVPLLVIVWWAFRPEKLWVNVKVNEPRRSAQAPTFNLSTPGYSLVGHIRPAGALQFIKHQMASAASG